MRSTIGLFPLAVAAIVVLAVGCQQRQEGEQGAPVDTAGAAADTGMAEGPAPGAGGATGGGEAGGGEAGGDDAAVGRQVFEANCATCHGADGSGMGPAGAGLQPPPANFTDSEWKYGGDLESVKRTIENGVPGTAMIAWKGTLSDAEITAVARHEIGLSKK